MIITLTGDDTFALKAELKRLTSEFVAQYGELSLEQLDGDEATSAQIVDTLQGTSLLVEAKMVVVQSIASHKELFETVDKLAENIPPTTSVILVEEKPDKRSKYYKALQKHTTYKEFSRANEKDLPGWVFEQTKARGGEISRGDANYLVARVGTDKSLLANELEKLITNNEKISRDQINELCEPLPQSTVFQLLDAAFAGNAKKTMEIYADQRKQRVEPMAIIGMIAWQLNILAVVKTGSDKSVDEVAKAAKLNPFVVRKSQSAAGKMSLRELKKLIHDCLELDARLKREPLNADDALQNLLLQIAQN